MKNKYLDVEYKEKVAIVGFAPSWNQAPFEDETFDIWGINELYLQAAGKRFTHWFEIHDPKSPSKSGEKHQTWLREAQIPLFMQKHYDEYPSSLPYPREEVKQMCNANFLEGAIGGKYTDFSNQITWMILLAILMDYKEIHVYGVDMAQASEYAWQRASCQFALGLAVGRGIKVLVPKTSELCKYPKDYGFESDNANRHLKKIRSKTLQDSVQGTQSRIWDLGFQYDKKHSDFVKYKDNVKDQLTKMGDEMVKMDISVAKNNELLKFLADMPSTIEEIALKKNGVIEQINKQNEILTKGLQDLEKQAKTIQSELNREEKMDFINKKSVEESIARLEKQMQSMGGAIGECNYDLQNNRV